MKVNFIKALLLVTLFTTKATGQDSLPVFSITGIISDSASGAALQNATINLIAGDSIVLQTAASKEDGSFEIKSIAKGKYSLIITTVGYERKIINVQLDEKSAKDMNWGKVFLPRKINELGEVKVVSNRLLIRQDIDRIIYDVQADPEKKIQNVLDMLRKVPLVSINAEEQIMLKGNSNFIIQIDGRPSPLVAHSPKEALRAMPASLIERIEVITNPPAKYDAEGIGGIINIITKKQNGQGYTGSANVSYGELYSAATGSITAKIRKVSISSFVANFWERLPASPFTNTLNFNSPSGTVIFQNGDKRYHGTTRIGSINMGIDIDTLHYITFSLSNVFLRGKNYSTQLTSSSDNNAFNYSYLLDRTADNTDRNTNFSFNFENGFKKDKRQLLTMSYAFSDFSNKQKNQSQVAQKVNYSENNLFQLNNTSLKEHTAQVDFVRPIQKIDAEFGIKEIYRKSFSDFRGQYSNGPGIYLLDSGNTNRYNYSQNIYAAYNSYSVRMKYWGLNAGLRYEITDIKADYQSQQTGIKSNFSNLIPTVTVKRRLNDFSNLNVGYTQRIQRPAIWQLNPFIDKTNRLFYFTGNPGLKPVRNHSITLDYTWFKKGFLNAGLLYSFSKNSLIPVTTIVQDSISYSSYYNIGTNKNLTTAINFNYPLSSRFNLSVNGTVSYITIDGVINNRDYSNSGFQGNAYTYLTCRLDKGVVFALNFGYYSSTVILQGSSSPYFYSSFSARKTLLKNKLTISGSVTNPFQKYRDVKSKLNTTEFYQETINNRYVRNITVGLNYTFGKLQESNLRRNKRSIRNDDTDKSANKGD